MPERLGAHAARVVATRELLSKTGRYGQRRYIVEGPQAVADARASGRPLEYVIATPAAYERFDFLREWDHDKLAEMYVADERTVAKISGADSPSGVVGVATMAPTALADLLTGPGVRLLLGDISDPGNAGTLMRSAVAFGVHGILFGDAGVDPYHPKVVRSAAGAFHAAGIAIADPQAVARAAEGAGLPIFGLAADGEPIAGADWPAALLLVVGHERRGLGRWEEICRRRVGIPMPGNAESLNAAVAGSIALYELTRGPSTGSG
jgi:RNA methyltransferase, TrmH family